MNSCEDRQWTHCKAIGLTASAKARFKMKHAQSGDESLLSHENPRSPGNSVTTWPWAMPSGTQLLSDSSGAPISNQTVPLFLNNVESVSSAKLTLLRKISEFQKHYSARLECKPHNFLSSFICGATFPANTALFLPEEGQESQTESPGSLCFSEWHWGHTLIYPDHV